MKVYSSSTVKGILNTGGSSEAPAVQRRAHGWLPTLNHPYGDGLSLYLDQWLTGPSSDVEPYPVPPSSPTPFLSGKGFVTPSLFPQHVTDTPHSSFFFVSNQPFISPSPQWSHDTGNYHHLWLFLLATLHLVGVFSILRPSLTQPPCLSPRTPPFLASS